MICPICKKPIKEGEEYPLGDQHIHQLCKHVMCGKEQLPGRLIEMSGKCQAIVRLGTMTVAYHISQLTPYHPETLTEEKIRQFEEEEGEEIV
jgi:hypothetical protein